LAYFEFNHHWDLNIVLSSDEVWGGSSGFGITKFYNKNLFTFNNLIDIKSTKLIPTRRNEHCGQEAITRRLDTVLVSEDLISDVGHYRSSVKLPYISDHVPIFFQLDLPPLYKAYTFKLNAQWLKDWDFVDLVFKFWKDPVFQSKGDKQHGIVWKLKILKYQTKLLLKEKLAKNKEKLVILESNIKDLIVLLASDPTNLEMELSLW